jgi:hypothetical protein
MTDYEYGDDDRPDPADGFTLDDGKVIKLEEALGIDHTVTGFTITGAIAGELLAFGHLVYFKSDNKFWRTDANAKATTEGELAFSLEAINAESTGEFLKYGYIRDDSWSFTLGDILFVDTTAGAISATKPSAIGDCVRRIGHAHATNIVCFNPDLMVIKL